MGIYGAGRAIQQQAQQQPRIDPPVQSNQWQPPPIAQTNNPPPLPVTMPAATPVAQLKNDTAMFNQYSPEAAQLLYDTPISVRYGETRTHRPSPEYPGFSGSEGIAGYYSQRPEGLSSELRPREITLNGGNSAIPLGQPGSYGNTLSHEFAHKWYGTQLSPELRMSWDNTAADIASPYASQRLESHPYPSTNELFAFNAERGPNEIQPQVRDYYYKGMYRDDLQPPLAPPPLMQKEPSTPFATDYWVNQSGAPRGYYEDGGAVESRLPYPNQWQVPKFPSLSMYQDFMPSYLQY